MCIREGAETKRNGGPRGTKEEKANGKANELFLLSG
jgi:hypothetical protein